MAEVTSEDVRAVAAAFQFAVTALGAAAASFPVMTEGAEALERMLSAAQGLPYLSQDERQAVTDAILLKAYTDQDFTRDEAFQIVCMAAEARLNVAVHRVLGGCQ